MIAVTVFVLLDMTGCQGWCGTQPDAPDAGTYVARDPIPADLTQPRIEIHDDVVVISYTSADGHEVSVTYRVVPPES
jgi:hypothetical protein